MSWQLHIILAFTVVSTRLSGVTLETPQLCRSMARMYHVRGNKACGASVVYAQHCTKSPHADGQLCCAAGCGVVPVKHVHLSDWFQDGYGADGAFFHQLSERLPRTYMIPKVLFMYTGAHG